MPLLPKIDFHIISYSELKSRHPDYLWFQEMEDTWIAQEIERNAALVHYAPTSISVDLLELDGKDCGIM